LKRNGRLSLALHTLTHMAGDPDRMRTSAEIAAHAGTNPVVVRRVLGRLRKAGLLTAEKGHAGGWKLARGAQTISLADVYLALEERMVAAASPQDPVSCAIERAMQSKVSGILDEVEQTLVAKLRETTIADIRND